MEALTKRQKSVLKIVQEYTLKHGLPPSIRYIAKQLAIEWPRAVEKHLIALEKKGFIKKTRRGPIPADFSFVTQSSQNQIMIPLVGTAAAGSPVFGKSDVLEYVPVDSRLIPLSRTGPASHDAGQTPFFFVKVVGNSMSGDGILDGDMALIERTVELQLSKIMLFWLDGESTIKRLEKRGREWMLVPSNPTYHALKLSSYDDARAIGIVRMIIRNRM